MASYIERSFKYVLCLHNFIFIKIYVSNVNQITKLKKYLECL